MSKLSDPQENPPACAKETAELLRWSANYDHPTPAALFMDIIGYSSDQGLGALYGPIDEDDSRWGYLEIGMLADALKEYSETPEPVMRYVEVYLEAEK